MTQPQLSVRERAREMIGEKLKYVPISRGGRNHTCEAWNGLGDDLSGMCIPEQDYVDELNSLIDQIITLAQEEKRKVLANLIESKKVLEVCLPKDDTRVLTWKGKHNKTLNEILAELKQ